MILFVLSVAGGLDPRLRDRGALPSGGLRSPARLRRSVGFTLIELLIVVVIIGILAAIAIPKFAATKDKAKLGSLKSDIRNIMTVQESYFSDTGSGYTTIIPTDLFRPSPGNTFVTDATSSSYSITATNSSISAPPTSCTVTVGDASATDGRIICS